MLSPNLTPARVIVLDVGGTFVKSAIIAPGGCVVGLPLITPINSAGTADIILATFAGIVRHHLEQVDGDNLLGVALGFPGPFDYQTGICYIKGLEKYGAIYGLNMAEALRQRVELGNRPIRFLNDAEAAIGGEARYGAGRPYQRLIGLTLGTGCGSAFLINGERVSSGQGVPPDGWLYPVLFRGDRADDIFSKRGLEARLRTVEAATIDIKEAAAAARRGDAAACQVFEFFGADLGEFLAPFVVDFQAGAVLVLGGIAGAFDLFGPPLRQALTVPVLPGERGADAALLGAADILFAKQEKTQC